MRHWLRTTSRAVGGIGPLLAATANGAPAAPRPLLRPSVWDWLGGALIAAALALLVIVAHLRHRPGTLD
jgi:hypothetical protein